MKIQDRTTEFFAAVSLKSSNRGSYGNQFDLHDASAARSTKSAIGHHSRFTQAALEVNNGIRSLLTTLENLTKRKQVSSYHNTYSH